MKKEQEKDIEKTLATTLSGAPSYPKNILWGLGGFVLGFGIPLYAVLFNLDSFDFQQIFPDLFLAEYSIPLVLIGSPPIILSLFGAIIGKHQDQNNLLRGKLEKEIQDRTAEKNKIFSYFQALIHNAPYAVVQMDNDHRIIDFNTKFEKLFGFSGEEIIGRSLDDLVATEDLLDEARGVTREIMNGSMLRLGSKRRRNDGKLIDVDIVGIPIFAEGEQVGLIGMYNDITDRINREQEIRESEARFRLLFEESPTSLWEEDFSQIKVIVDEVMASGVEDLETYLLENRDMVEQCVKAVKIINVNQATLKLYEAKNKETLLDNFSNTLVEDSLEQFAAEIVSLANGNRRYECEINQRTISGKQINAILNLSVVPGFEDTWGRVLVSIIDNTDRKIAEEKLRYLSFHDALTDTYNRAYFETELERLEFSRRYPVSILVLDIDNLKNINDTLGHVVGDQAIRAVAKVCKETFRSEDVVSRIGGDEFAVILPNIDISDTPTILKRLKDEFNKFNNDKADDGFYRPISASFGFASVSKGESLLEGLKTADQNMYANKKAKKLLALNS